MRISLGDVMMVAVIFLLSLCSLAAADDGTKMDDMNDKHAIRMIRSFGSPDKSARPFSGHSNDMVDWNDFFSTYSRPSKRQMNSYHAGFGGANGLDNGNYQNWNDYFARKYRSFVPGQGSGKGLGLDGFGVDGLQNWRAFFDGRRIRFRR